MPGFIIFSGPSSVCSGAILSSRLRGEGPVLSRTLDLLPLGRNARLKQSISF